MPERAEQQKCWFYSCAAKMRDEREINITHFALNMNTISFIISDDIFLDFFVHTEIIHKPKHPVSIGTLSSRKYLKNLQPGI
jgi:hypothetical protein